MVELLVFIDARMPTRRVTIAQLRVQLELVDFMVWPRGTLRFQLPLAPNLAADVMGLGRRLNAMLAAIPLRRCCR
jgi:hypothetical protein